MCSLFTLRHNFDVFKIYRIQRYIFYHLIFLQNSVEGTAPNSLTNSLNGSENRSLDPDTGRMFLDTTVMCNSPSANYYKPTDEPEPWDITQLNIEASVMCLVSKVKFLCGRCGSPAVRLKQNVKSFKKAVITDQPGGGNLINKEAEAVSKAVNKVVRNGEYCIQYKMYLSRQNFRHHYIKLFICGITLHISTYVIYLYAFNF